MNLMITSLQNERVKGWRKLHNRKERWSSGLFFIEGYHLVEAACQSDFEIIEIIIQENNSIPDYCSSHSITRVTKRVFKHITETETPQGIAAVVKIKQKKYERKDQVLLIDGIQDPGNLGTIIRTADAAGFSLIVLGDGTVDMYNDKVLRATQGSIFHVPIIQANLNEKISILKNDGFTVWATGLNDAINYNDVSPKEKMALILGNEGAGVQSELMALADEVVNIPIYGSAESLNVSIAAGILMYYIKG